MKWIISKKKVATWKKDIKSGDYALEIEISGPDQDSAEDFSVVFTLKYSISLII